MTDERDVTVNVTVNDQNLTVIGNEIAVMAPWMDKSEVQRWAERIAARLSDPPDACGRSHTFSVGGSNAFTVRCNRAFRHEGRHRERHGDREITWSRDYTDTQRDAQE